MLSRDTRTLWLIVCQIILRAVTVESGFHKTPSNTVAVVGQLMKMTCWTNPNDTTQWLFSQYVERTSSIVYNGESVSPNFTSRFNVDNSTAIGHHDLTAKSVSMRDAGIYECVVLYKETKDRSIPVSATAQLIVLESEPHCKSNISGKDGSIKEFDYVAFRCAVNFSGPWAPSMQWSTGERALNETPIAINSNVSHGVQFLSSVVIFQVTAELKGIQITCKTRFYETSMKANYTNATNVPNYLFQWNTTLNVHYGARNVAITPQRDRYRQEDVLNCTADGNPSPSYTWRNFRTQETTAVGPQLALNATRIDADQRHTIECVAQNLVDGEIKLSSATLIVTVSGTWQLPFGNITAAGVSIFCTLLTVFILKLVQKKITSRKSRNRANISNVKAESLSPDYDSLPEAEINESPPTSTTPDTADPTENASEAYSALTERPVIVHQPIVYSSLEASSSHVVDASKRVAKGPPVYVNMTIE